MPLGTELIICCRRKQLGPGPLTTTTTITTTTTTTTATDNRATHQGAWWGEMRWWRRRESAPNTRRTARTRYGTHCCLFASNEFPCPQTVTKTGRRKTAWRLGSFTSTDQTTHTTCFLRGNLFPNLESRLSTPLWMLVRSTFGQKKANPGPPAPLQTAASGSFGDGYRQAVHRPLHGPVVCGGDPHQRMVWDFPMFVGRSCTGQ